MVVWDGGFFVFREGVEGVGCSDQPIGSAFFLFLFAMLLVGGDYGSSMGGIENRHTKGAKYS